MDVIEPSMECDFDYTFPIEQDELFHSQPAQVDSVKWQSSQPSSCAALNNLILEVSTVPVRRKLTHETSWYNPEASSSTSPQPPVTNNPRPLTRTNSRPRFGRHSEPNIQNPSQAPDFGLFDKNDPMKFLDIVKGVSERVDENAGMRGGRNGDLSGIKRKIRVLNSDTVAPTAKVRKSRPAHKQETANWVNKNQAMYHSDDVEGGSQRTDVANRGLPGLSSSLSTTASSSSLRSPNTSVSTDVEILDVSDSMEVEEGDQHVSMTSIPSFISKVHPLTHHGSTASSLDSSPRSDSKLPKLHPLLVQQQAQSQRGPQPKAQVQHPMRTHQVAQEQRQQPQHVQPNLTQGHGTARQPALGMRRTHSSIISAPAQKSLPTRQKGFKPPLLPGTQSQTHSHTQQPPSATAPQATVSAGNTAPVQSAPKPPHTSDRGQEREKGAKPTTVVSKKESPPPRARASSPDTDADLSFGDMSFDMDALEETMRMYD